MSDADDVRDLVAREDKSIQRAFRVFVRRVRDPEILGDIIADLRAKDVNSAMMVMENYISDFADELPKSFVRAARDEMRRATLAVGETSVAFDDTDADTVAAMRRNRLEFVKGFTQKQKASISAALADSLENGDGEKATARAIRDSIGLTDGQVKAVNSYRDLLERGSVGALSRELRDRRSDSTVTNAIERGDVLTDSQIDRMVGRYADNMLNLRARTIARTETQSIVNAARHESWRQMRDTLDIDDEDIVRTWHVTKDGRQRDSHDEMDEQEARGLDEPFISGNGNELLYPGDRSAPADDVISCRCSVTMRIDRADDE